MSQIGVPKNPTSINPSLPLSHDPVPRPGQHWLMATDVYSVAKHRRCASQPKAEIPATTQSSKYPPTESKRLNGVALYSGKQQVVTTELNDYIFFTNHNQKRVVLD